MKEVSSRQLNTFDEVTEAFLAYSPPDMKGHYRLDRIRALMTALGNPQEKLKAIHIAGTSGKTSTAYFIRGFLETADQKTGLTVSPHIVAINERVQIGGIPLEKAAFLRYANQFLSLVDKTDLAPTYFEFLIGLAYWVFAEEKVDYAVVETGLGGLFDATNVVSRPDKVCVITDIGLDHTRILGETLPEIAAQKAGIIHPNNHVIIHKQHEAVLNVVREAAHRLKATINIITQSEAPARLPVFQRRNWALAKVVFEYVMRRDGFTEPSEKQLLAVIAQTPPGRWESYRFNNKLIILDGAHNPQKLQALRDSLIDNDIDSVAVLANFITAPESKITDSLEALRAITTHLIIPEFRAGYDKGRRSLSAPTLQALARQRGFRSTEAQPDATIALQSLLKRPEKTLIITGSLYLVSTLRPLVIKETTTSDTLIPINEDASKAER